MKFEISVKLVALAIVTVVTSGCTGQPQIASPVTPASNRSTPTLALGKPPNSTLVPQLASQSALDSVRARGELWIGILYNNPPFSYRSDNGDVRGYEPDLLTNMANDWGISLKFVPVTRQTRISLLMSGKIDMVAGAFPHRRELEQFVSYSATTFDGGIVPLAANDLDINSIKDFGDKPIGVVGNDAQSALATYESDAGIIPTMQLFHSLDDAESAYRSGGIRILVGRKEDMMRASSTLQNATVLNEFVLEEPYAFAVRRGDTPLRDLLNLSLNKLAQDGTLSQVYGANLFGYADNFQRIKGDSSAAFTTFQSKINTSDMVLPRLRRGEALRVGGFGMSQQVSAFDSGPVVDGFNRAVVNEMARRWNVPIVEIPQSGGDQGLALLNSNQSDLIVGIRPSTTNIGLFGLSEAYYRRSIRLLHLSGVTINGIGDLNYKSVDLVDPLDEGQDLVQKNSEFAKVTIAASSQEAYQSLVAGSTYAIVGDEYSLFLMTKADNRLIFDNSRYRPLNYVMAFPVNDTDLRP